MDAQIEDADAGTLAAGQPAIRRRTEALFEQFPNLNVRKVARLAVGPFIVQEEEVSGREPQPERHIAVCRVIDGLITHERLLR